MASEFVDADDCEQRAEVGVTARPRRPQSRSSASGQRNLALATSTRPHETSTLSQGHSSKSLLRVPKQRRGKRRRHRHQHQHNSTWLSSSSPSDEQIRERDVASGFEVAWLDFSYSVGPNWLEDPRWGRINSLFHKHHRTILRELSGNFRSGQLVALMGPSGAGKTCLLETIAGVRATGLSGRLCVRGRKKLQLSMVPQYDNFMPQFTVEEIIAYGSKMKNKPSADHRAIVDRVIEQLGLGKCRSTRIMRCSGGQQKRVAIAQELVSRPNILILDEPTSGLDSSCCYQTMKVLRDITNESVHSDEPMAIVTTIHQPSAKVFYLFDLVYILGKTGKFTYSGRPDKLLETIQQVTGLECPQYSNPSDYMIELAAYDYGQEPVDKLVDYEVHKAQELVRQFEARSKGHLSPRRSDQNRLALPGTQSRRPDHSPTSRRSDDLAQQAQNIFDDISMSSTCSSFASSRSTSPIGGGVQNNGYHEDQDEVSDDNDDFDDDHEDDDDDVCDEHCGQCEMQEVQSIEINLNDDLPDDLLGINCPPDRDYVVYRNNVTTELRSAASNRHYKHPFFWHTYIHFHRSLIQSVRDPILNNMRILIHLVFASLLVLLYGQKSGEARGCPPILGLPTEITDPNNELMVDLSDNIGFLFMCIMLITYVSLMSMVLTFPIDIKTVGKEYKNGWYGTTSYFIGKNMADLPFIIVYPFLYCCITWFATHQGQDHGWRFLSFTGLIIINAMNSQSFGLILGACFVNSVTAATFLGPVITTPWYLFTGFTKRIHRLAWPFKNASKFLFTRYVFEGLLDTVYGHKRCNCSEFLEKYYQLREEEVARLGQIISDETLSSLDYYDGIDYVQQQRWLEKMANSSSPSMTGAGEAVAMSLVTSTADSASNLISDADQLDLTSLIESNGRASSLFSFGLDFEPTCPSDYKNYIVQDFHLDDMTSKRGFIWALGLLLFIRCLTLVVVTWKIRTRQI